MFGLYSIKEKLAMKNKDLIKKIEDVGLIQKQQFIFIAFLILLGMFTPINSTHILMGYGLVGLCFYIAIKLNIYNLDKQYFNSIHDKQKDIASESETVGESNTDSTSDANVNGNYQKNELDTFKSLISNLNIFKRFRLAIDILFYRTAIVMFIFAFVKMFIVEHMKVPSESMMPNINVGTILYVNKTPSLSQLFSNANDGYSNNDLQRGDVVVFKYPNNHNILFVKRLIGLPNDVIEVKEQTIYLNGVELKHKFVRHDKQRIQRNANNLVNETNIYSETLPSDRYYMGEKQYLVAINTDEQVANNKNPLQFPILDNGIFNATDYCQVKSMNHIICKIPNDKYFMMGDNRNFSADSRFWGLVDKSEIVGVVKYYFPFKKIT